jgi:membrane-associated phospholipid phosphatase
MDAIMQWGVELILAIQAARTPEMDAFFRAITHLGGMAHMYIVPLLIWCLGYRFGARLLLTLLLSTAVNFWLKDLFAQPRPFQMDARIGPDREFGHGIPSGHAQHTAVEWGGIAAWIGIPWFTAFALLLIALIGYSRVYLGVHYPSDVIAGWMLAVLILWLHLRYAERIASTLAARSLAQQLAAAVVVSLLFVLAYAILPNTTYLVGSGGLFLGAAAGIAICLRRGLACEGGTWWQRVLRYPLGLVPLLFWASAAGKWVPETHDLAYFLIIYANCAVAGAWLTLGAPALFRVARLSRADA